MYKDFEMLSLIMELNKTVRCCQQDVVLCEDVTLTQFYILDLVANKGEIRLADLHGLLAVEKSTTTRLVDPLVKRQLVVREKSEDDSRAINIRLTPKGTEVHQNVWQCIMGFLNLVEKNIPENQREEVYRSVRIFFKALRDASISCC